MKNKFYPFSVIILALTLSNTSSIASTTGETGDKNSNDNPPIFSSGTAISVDENQTATGYSATATDADGTTPTYSLTGGLDQNQFSIDSNSGELRFQSAPDYEAPNDNDSNNTYLVEITATDGTNSVAKDVTVTVTNTNDNPPIFSSDTTISVDENQTATGYSAVATDADGTTPTYSLTGGSDQTLFSIDRTSGVLSFQSTPDYEAPGDSDSNNIYVVEITSTDESNSVAQSVTVTIINTNDNSPSFTSGTTISVDENNIATGYIAAATDADGTTPSYSLTGGEDKAAFSIDNNSGALSFQSAPNFESASDSDSNNSYAVEVSATDGSHSVAHDLTVTVTNINDNPPVFSSGTDISVDENSSATGYRATATDADGTTPIYSLTGGLDQPQFSIDSNSGLLSFQAAADFEAATDSDSNNIYLVEISASDGTNTETRDVTVTVSNTNDNPPVFTSDAAISVNENTKITGYTAMTADEDGDTVTFNLSGGADQSEFSLNANNGILSFKSEPDFEAASDSDRNNTYVVEITATDGIHTVTQEVTVAVSNTNDNPPVFSSGTAIRVDENNKATGYNAVATDADGSAPTYSLTGGLDQAQFSIDSNSGLLSFQAEPDFEAASDSDRNNTYAVEITATDGTHTVAQEVTVTVTNINDNPPIFTSGTTINVDENSSATGYRATATDADGTTPTYSLTGGLDQAAFNIDNNTGELNFQVAADFETASDNDANNTYLVEISATDGTKTVAQEVIVTIINTNDNPPVFNSGTAISVEENQTATGYRATATDADGTTPTYSLTGGLDQAKFSIDSNSGLLSFQAAADFEVAADSDANNTYLLEISATDGTNTAKQDVTVTIINTNDNPPVFSSGTAISVEENQTETGYRASATDADDTTPTYSLTGGLDQTLFSIDANSGVLSFQTEPNFEKASDSDANNIYAVEISATDGSNAVKQDITITVTNINDTPPIFSSGKSISVDENNKATGYNAVATDADGTTPTYSLTGGFDQALFSIDSNTGQLSFQAAADFETPTDSDSNNTYQVEITATDGSNSVAQNVAIIVKNIFDITVQSVGIKTIQFDWPAHHGATNYKLFSSINGESELRLLQDNIVSTNTRIERPVHLTDWINAHYILEAHDSTGKLAQSPPVSIGALMLSSIGYVKASNSEANDFFGYAVSLSADGYTLAVGTPYEDSNATGISTDSSGEADNSAAESGAVYIFSRSGNNWNQQAYIKASNSEANDSFGYRVSLSADGNTLAASAYLEYGNTNSSDTTGENNNAVGGSGAVYVFTRSGSSWTQQAYLKASNSEINDTFGAAVSLSADGNTLAVGDSYEDSNATGISTDGSGEADNSAAESGAVYVFSRSDNNWIQQAYIKASNSAAFYYFGTAVSLSADGNTLAVGAHKEFSNATGISTNGSGETDQSAEDSGAVYVFSRSDNAWRQQAYIKSSNSEPYDLFGWSVSLSADGNTLAVGAYSEDSNDGTSEADNSAINSGAVYVFSRSDSTWTQQAYIKASNSEAGDFFGYTISLSADGNNLAVGAYSEDSNATGVNSTGTGEADNSAISSGAAYIFSRNASNWIQQSYIKASNSEKNDLFGWSISLTGDGKTLAVGARWEDSNATGVGGDEGDNSAEASGAVYLY